MLRLRTSSGLSLLGLLIGVTGTAWLSILTVDSAVPAAQVAAVRQSPSVWHAKPRPGPLHGAISVVAADAVGPEHFRRGNGVSPAVAIVPSMRLQPLSMPSDTSQSWDQLRGHLDGRLRLHVNINGMGDVVAARITESSGDPVLDQHALRSVRLWRFTVPANHPDGVDGELPMLFASSDATTRAP